MKRPDEKYRRYLFFGLILIALGVVLNTTVKEFSGTLGTVLIAFGGLMFIVGMKMKKDKAEQ